MNNERFSIPEVLFHPSDIGIQEMGISEAIIHTINGTPEGKLDHFFLNNFYCEVFITCIAVSIDYYTDIVTIVFPHIAGAKPTLPLCEGIFIYFS